MRLSRALTALALVLVSCTDSAGPGTASPLGTAFAQYSIAESYFGLGISRGGASELGPAGAMPASCPYVVANTRFECSPVTTSGVTVTRAYRLLDGSNQPLAEFDAATVAAIRVQSSASGTVTTSATSLSPATSTTFTSSSDYTYGGLLASVRHIDGSGTTSSTLTVNGKTATSTSARTVLDIRPALTEADRAASVGWGFPMHGIVSSVVSGTDTAGVAYPSTIVETTFNGTATVVTKVTKNSTTVTYTCTYEQNTGGSQIFVSCLQS